MAPLTVINCGLGPRSASSEAQKPGDVSQIRAVILRGSGKCEGLSFHEPDLISSSSSFVRGDCQRSKALASPTSLSIQVFV